jgi:hypothetical protein
MNPVHSYPLNFCNIHSNIIFPSTSSFLRSLFPSGFRTIILYTLLLFHSCHMTRISHASYFEHLNNILVTHHWKTIEKLKFILPPLDVRRTHFISSATLRRNRRTIRAFSIWSFLLLLLLLFSFRALFLRLTWTLNFNICLCYSFINVTRRFSWFVLQPKDAFYELLVISFYYFIRAFYLPLAMNILSKHFLQYSLGIRSQMIFVLQSPVNWIITCIYILANWEILLFFGRF